MNHALKLLVILTGALLSMGAAQNVTVLYAPDLAITHAEIIISPGYHTRIQFHDTARNVASGRIDLVTIDDIGTELILTTNQAAGNTDLSVEVAGRTLLFFITVSVEDPLARIYRVKRDRERAFAPSYAPATPLTELPSQEPALVPQESLGDLGKGRLELGSATFTETGFNIPFSFVNDTGARLVLDPTRLTARQGNEPRKLRVAKEPIRNLLSAGEIQTGTITVIGAEPGLPVSLSWETMILGSEGGRKVRAEASVDAR